jgi:hypothetical protein
VSEFATETTSRSCHIKAVVAAGSKRGPTCGSSLSAAAFSRSFTSLNTSMNPAARRHCSLHKQSKHVARSKGSRCCEGGTSWLPVGTGRRGNKATQPHTKVVPGAAGYAAQTSGTRAPHLTRQRVTQLMGGMP